MGLGGTAKKVQQMADIAEKLVARFKELRDEVMALREQLDDTNDRVQDVESELDSQRKLLEALAEKEGIDVDAVTAETDATEAEEPPAEP